MAFLGCECSRRVPRKKNRWYYFETWGLLRKYRNNISHHGLCGKKRRAVLQKIYSESKQRFRRPPCGLGRWATTNLHNSLQRTQPGFPQKSAMEAVPLSPFLWVTKVCDFERLSNFGLWCVGGFRLRFLEGFFILPTAGRKRNKKEMN